LDGIRKLVNSDFTGPVNIGSDYIITLNDLVQMIIEISGKNISINYIPGTLDICTKGADNKLIEEKLG
jgi:nucleoside-diphosphate-sugar epimerase